MAGQTLEGGTFEYENWTPHDTNVITRQGTAISSRFPIKGFMVNTAGNVVTKNANGDSVTHYGCAAGIIYPIRTTRILATGTTATSVVVYFN